MERVYILLHTCCAPCATASVERLIAIGYSPVLFFSNSNISPREEFDKRLDEARRLASTLEIALYEDEYDHTAWLKAVSKLPGYAEEPEGGRRCAACFEFSFRRAEIRAAASEIPVFTTTLSVSPYKKSRQLFDVGALFPGFEPVDFKKKEGYKRSIELSRKYGLHRQNYCGCEFSRREKP
jgi:epoxyqueuosine reductase